MPLCLARRVSWAAHSRTCATLPGAPVNGRANKAVAELHLGVVNDRLLHGELRAENDGSDGICHEYQVHRNLKMIWPTRLAQTRTDELRLRRSGTMAMLAGAAITANMMRRVSSDTG